MRRFGFIILLTLCTSISWGQRVDLARTTVQTLASDTLYGRGYVNRGDSLAADYIAQYFTDLGLTSFTDNYLQSYSFPMNTFPGNVLLKVNSRKLKPGKDFYVSCSSPSVSGNFKTMSPPTGISTPKQLMAYLRTQQKVGCLLVDPSFGKLYGQNLPHVPVAILVESKPEYWHVSNGAEVGETTWFKVDSSAIGKSPKKISVEVETHFFNQYPTQNVVGYVPGTTHPEKFVVFTAHYDHLGMMGDQTIFPGANDNASGTAMVMDLARHFAQNPAEYSVAFILLSGEEAGLHGSTYYAEHPLFPLNEIGLLVNLDMVGSGSEGITVVNGKLYPELAKKMDSINDVKHLLPDIALRGESCNSDHCPFYQKGVKSVFIYTRGKELKAYHTIEDKYTDDFPFTAYDGLFKLLLNLVNIQ